VAKGGSRVSGENDRDRVLPDSARQEESFKREFRKGSKMPIRRMKFAVKKFSGTIDFKTGKRYFPSNRGIMKNGSSPDSLAGWASNCRRIE
jgi:hypothetical protein